MVRERERERKRKKIEERNDTVHETKREIFQNTVAQSLLNYASKLWDTFLSIPCNR